MKKIVKVIIALALVIATLSPMAVAASRSAKVIAGSMTVYNSRKKAIGSLKYGTHVTITATKGSWARLKYKGKTCYGKIKNLMYSKGTKAVTTKDAHFEFVTKSSYKKGTYYKATLAAGTTVYICGTSGSKYLVRNAKNTAYGYIAKSAVQKAK